MNKINYAWDSCTVIAWFCEEPGAPLDDMALVVGEIDAERANLVISVVTYSEILESKYTESQRQKFELFLKRSNVVTVDTTIPVARKAAKIRDAALRESRKIKTPDATILAASVMLGVDVLHTLDDQLLALSGSPVVDGLQITKPCLISGQRALLGT